MQNLFIDSLLLMVGDKKRKLNWIIFVMWIDIFRKEINFLLKIYGEMQCLEKWAEYKIYIIVKNCGIKRMFVLETIKLVKIL